ncbi:MAG TPA: hypothetical protein QF604_00870 [Candidatus Latescibacteria bacterium]|nr:hypothetical protein [Gemmatimonadota bacterium]MDP7362397.1 hypothetical protein [Candidatus Latescibacterota bacterium]MDP7632107.1 hypothetical protein [Candidatus Latescibacterota bacterium]HCV26502.1 hypothetical protein [Candidatus Latescibacterota bacterium]HJN26446.1 hypothetical protein [Candidatus Latescibacterota bacterium]
MCQFDVVVHVLGRHRSPKPQLQQTRPTRRARRIGKCDSCDLVCLVHGDFSPWHRLCWFDSNHLDLVGLDPQLQFTRQDALSLIYENRYREGAIRMLPGLRQVHGALCGDRVRKGGWQLVGKSLCVPQNPGSVVGCYCISGWRRRVARHFPEFDSKVLQGLDADRVSQNGLRILCVDAEYTGLHLRSGVSFGGWLGRIDRRRFNRSGWIFLLRAPCCTATS